MKPARERLLGIHRAALAAVDPEAATRRAAADLPADAPLWVLAAGKAAATMARGLESACGARIAEGRAIIKDGHGRPLGHLPVSEAGHPVPDQRSARAGLAALELAGRCPPEAVFVVLLSGGASALLTLPQGGLTLRDLAETTRVLLETGAEIDVLNAVRKHLTLVSGGRLARAAEGAREIWLLAISDVPDDDLATLASGPCSADPTTFAEARAGALACGAWPRLPESVRAHLDAGCAGGREESLDPGAPVLARVQTRVLASNATALAAARVAGSAAGMRPLVLADELRGEAREVGRRIVGLANARAPGRSALILAGGETTVRVRGKGRGGRCQELALASALAWQASPPVGAPLLLAVGTDGTDGPTDAAGAFADPQTVARGRRAGRDAAADLADNDAYGFFEAEGGLLRTGPTGTNVRDLLLLDLGAGS